MFNGRLCDFVIILLGSRSQRSRDTAALAHQSGGNKRGKSKQMHIGPSIFTRKIVQTIDFFYNESIICDCVNITDYTGYFTILSGFKNFIKQKVNKIKQ